MAKSKIKQILSWGWRGIEVWSILSSLGATTMMRGIFKGMVSGWVWYDQLFLFGGLFLLILGVLALIINRRRTKRDISVQTTTNTDEQKDVNSHDEPRTLWLEQILEVDKQGLGNRIHQFRERWFFDNIYATEPFIEVIIQIVNAAVFPVVIKGVEGSFQIQGTKCNWDATMVRSGIPRGESGNIRISQRLLKETVDMMVKLNNERGGFMVDLNACRLVIQAEEPNAENESVKVPLRIRERVRITT